MQTGPVEPIKFPPEPKEVALQERRLGMRLMAHWQGLRMGHPCALAAKFDHRAIADLWPDCFMLMPAQEWSKSPFNHIGERIGAQANLRETSIALSEVPPSTLLSTALQGAGDVLRLRHPLLESGDFTTPKGEKCLYRSILLPLEGEDGNIEALLGGARCKVVEAAG